MSRKVFVIQEQRDKNLLPAEKFGEIEVLLTNRDVDRGIEHCAQILVKKLEFIQPTDYLILVGDPVMIGLGMHIALHYLEDNLTVLRWDRIHYKYNPETIKI